MQRAKQFMFISIGILALVAAYQLGVKRANAQTGDATIASLAVAPDHQMEGFFFAMTPGGDLYRAQNHGPGNNPWEFVSNVFGHGPISIEKATVGDVKGKYKDEEDE